MPLMQGRVIERTKFLITQLLIEATRLKAERIKPRRVTAAFNRARFGPSHQLTPDTAAAEIMADPEIFDYQPSAIGFSRQAGDDRFRIANKDAKRAQGAWPGYWLSLKSSNALESASSSAASGASSTVSWYCCGSRAQKMLFARDLWRK
jgi:hypothetical protein